MRALGSSLFGLLLLLFVGVVAAQTPTLMIAPDVIPLGSPFNVTASGLTPNTTYTFAIVNAVNATSVFETQSTSNATGRIALNLTTDAKTDQPGAYRIELRQADAIVVQQDFQLQAADQPTPPPPTSANLNLSMAPSEGPVGTAFEILIASLSAGQAVTVSIIGPDGSEAYTTDRTAKDDGTVNVKIFTETSDAPGIYTVTARSGDFTSQTTFSLTATAPEEGTVTVTPKTLDKGLSYEIAIENVKPFADLTITVKSPTSKDNLFQQRVRASVDGKANVVFTPETTITVGDYDVVVLDRGTQVATSTITIDDSALAFLGGAVLRISPPQGEAGSLRLITISGLDANEPIIIEIAQGMNVVSTQNKVADVNGTVALGLRDIGDNSAGDYDVRVLRGGKVVATSPLSIVAVAVQQPTSPVAITIDPTSAALGSSHNVQISGLNPSETLTINVVFDGNTVYATDKVADENGVVTMSLNTDSKDAAGTYTINVIHEGETLASADFEATAEVAQPDATTEPQTPSVVTITVDPASGPQGTQHVIHVEGLAPNAVISIDLVKNDQVVFSSEKTASSTGVVEFAIQTEESDTLGDYVVSVRQGDVALASTALTIDASTAQTDQTPTPEATPAPTETPVPTNDVTIAVDPISGPRGTTHLITVTGLAANETVQYEVFFDSTSILSGDTTADESGTAVLQLTSEELDGTGEYVIDVRRNEVLLATAVLTVEDLAAQTTPTPIPPQDVSIKIDPPSGEVGSSHAVTVTGLAANESAVINVTFDGEVVYTVTKTANDQGEVSLTLSTSPGDNVGIYTVSVVVNEAEVISGNLEVLAATTENVGPEGTATPDNTNENTGPEGQDQHTNVIPSAETLLDVSDTLVDTAKEYTFSGQQGDNIIATLFSDIFDPYLTLRGPDGADISSNDDFYGLNSQIGPVTLPQTGEYTLVVSSYSTYNDLPVGGDFMLQVKTVSLQEITTDSPQTLTFSPDIQLYYFNFAGAVGDVIDITVTSAEGVDTALSLTDANGAVITTDDDSGEGYNPEIYHYSLSATGTYTILLSTSEMAGSAELMLHTESAASLNDGTQDVQITSKLYSRALTYDAQEGEKVLLNVSIAGGDPVDLTISAYQGDVSLMSYSTTSHIPDGTVLGFEVPATGQVQIFVSGTNPGAVTVELSVGK